jgi:hypothetical protein
MSLITALIYIIVALIIVGVIFWAIQQLLPLIPLPEPFRRIIYVLLVVILVLIVVFVILQLFGLVGGLHLGHISSFGMLAAAMVPSLPIGRG